jgi:hypothetical protein
MVALNEQAFERGAELGNEWQVTKEPPRADIS